MVPPGIDPAPLTKLIEEKVSLDEAEQPYPEMEINESGLDQRMVQYCPCNVRGGPCPGRLPDLGIPNFCTRKRYCWTWLRDNATGRVKFSDHLKVSSQF